MPARLRNLPTDQEHGLADSDWEHALGGRHGDSISCDWRPGDVW